MTFEPDRLDLREAGPDAPYDWLLTANLTWTGTFRGGTGCLVVEASDDAPFKTDLASVPRWMTWLFPPYGNYTKAAVLHDYLCQNVGQTHIVCLPGSPLGGPGRATPAGEHRPLPVGDRSDADEVFREAMRELGVPGPRRWLMWSAVSWKTVAASLWPGRGTKRRARTAGAVVGSACVASGAVAGWSCGGAAGLVLVGIPALAVGVMLGGYIAQGRWDRWAVYLAALAMTAAMAPLLLAGLAVGILAVAYRAVETLLSLGSTRRRRLEYKESSRSETAPRAERRRALQAS